MKELVFKRKIPVLKEFLVGKISPVERMDINMVKLRSEKKEDLMVYEKHPEHVKLVKKILPNLKLVTEWTFSHCNVKTKIGTADYKGHFIHAFNFKFKDGVSDDEMAELMGDTLKEKFLSLKNY